MTRNLCVLSGKPKWFPSFFCSSRFAKQRLLLLLTLVSAVWISPARSSVLDIYYHNCTMLPQYPNCSGYTGQEFAGMALHIDLAGSFPDGDYHIELNHPDGYIARHHIEFSNDMRATNS